MHLRCNQTLLLDRCFQGCRWSRNLHSMSGGCVWIRWGWRWNNQGTHHYFYIFLFLIFINRFWWSCQFFLYHQPLHLQFQGTCSANNCLSTGECAVCGFISAGKYEGCDLTTTMPVCDQNSATSDIDMTGSSPMCVGCKKDGEIVWK